MRVAYMCDGHGCAAEHPSCRDMPVGDPDRCTHTTDPEHAVNGACEHPENYPERFDQYGEGVFFEKDA